MPGRRRQLLIVDRDARLAGIYAGRFEAARWTVRVAGDVRDAAKLISKKVPDAALLDMDEVPGAVAFVRELKAASATSGIKVVALTRRGGRAAMRFTRDAGADGHLVKGHVTASDVGETLERLVVSGTQRM